MLHALLKDETDPAKVDVSVIIVSYHCRDDVLACVESIFHTPPNRSFEVTVVDNGSTDGTLEALTQRTPDVTVIPMGVNAGFSKANNAGMVQSRGRYVCVLNPDTLVEPGALDLLANWLESHPEAAVAAPQLLNADGTDQRTARSFPTPAAALFGRRSPLTRWFPKNRWSTSFLTGSTLADGEPFQIDWVSGAAMMVPSAVIEEVGGFDEAFFLFWEDADWCKRMADAGYEVWCVPAARVIHDEGGTRSHGWAPRTVAHFHRGAYLYWRKHHAPQAWNPLRWVGAGVLCVRALAVMANEQARTRRGHDRHPAVASPSPVPIPQPSR